MRKTSAAFSILFATAFSISANAATPPLEIAVSGPRVRMADVLPNVATDSADIDLGPSPIGGSRVIERADMLQAFHDRNGTAPKKMPDAVRIVRKVKKLDAVAIEKIVREALLSKLPKGATLSAVRAPRMMDVADGWTTIVAELPRPPRRSGPFPTSANVSFMSDSAVLARINVPVDLMLSAEAAMPDAARGSTITLVIRRGLIEVTTATTATADADIGGTLPLLIHESGHLLQAKLIDKTHAVALEDL